MAIVSESHLVIHTWPEYGYAAVDLFTCGAPRDPHDALAVLRAHFQPERIGVMEINRGQMELPEYERPQEERVPASRGASTTPKPAPAYSA